MCFFILGNNDTSRPLVHAIVCPLNRFHVISLNSHYFSSLIPTLIDLMFYSKYDIEYCFFLLFNQLELEKIFKEFYHFSTRNSPKEGYETFFHFSIIDGDVSIVLDDEALAR